VLRSASPTCPLLGLPMDGSAGWLWHDERFSALRGLLCGRDKASGCTHLSIVLRTGSDLPGAGTPCRSRWTAQLPGLSGQTASGAAWGEGGSRAAASDGDDRSERLSATLR